MRYQKQLFTSVSTKTVEIRTKTKSNIFASARIKKTISNQNTFGIPLLYD